jgi:hypothetical protein
MKIQDPSTAKHAEIFECLFSDEGPLAQGCAPLTSLSDYYSYDSESKKSFSRFLGRVVGDDERNFQLAMSLLIAKRSYFNLPVHRMAVGMLMDYDGLRAYLLRYTEDHEESERIWNYIWAVIRATPELKYLRSLGGTTKITGEYPLCCSIIYTSLASNFSASPRYLISHVDPNVVKVGIYDRVLSTQIEYVILLVYFCLISFATVRRWAACRGKV